MDIKKLDVVGTSERGVWMVFHDPRTAEPTDFKVRVRGSFSKKFRESLSRIRATYEATKKREDVLDAETEAALESVAALSAESIVDWEGLFEDGVPVPYSPEAALNLCRACPPLVEQITATIRDTGSFFGS